MFVSLPAWQFSSQQIKTLGLNVQKCLGERSQLRKELRSGMFQDDIQRSEEHTSELQSHHDLVCRLLLEKKNTKRQ